MNANKTTFDGVVVRCGNAIDRLQSTVSQATDVEKSVAIRMTLSELPTTELATAVNYAQKDTFDSLDRFVIEQSLEHGPSTKHTKRTLVDDLSDRVIEAL
jgi:hypothetical protein